MIKCRRVTLQLVLIILSTVLLLQYYLASSIREPRALRTTEPSIIDLKEHNKENKESNPLVTVHQTRSQVLSKQTPGNSNDKLPKRVDKQLRDRLELLKLNKLDNAKKSQDSCVVIAPQSEPINTDFKIYIYDLPSKFNQDLRQCAKVSNKCYKTELCGAGPLLYRESDLSVHETWQFSLEVILHHKLMFSPYRTMDPSSADVFYIPFYPALSCFCQSEENSKEKRYRLLNELSEFLSLSPFYSLNYPHLMTLGKIEREHYSARCGILRQATMANVSFIGIEQESSIRNRELLDVSKKPFIVAPYPSYGHFHSTKPGLYLRSVLHSDRNVFAFLATSTRTSNWFRSKVLDQFSGMQTSFSHKHYFSNQSRPNSNNSIVKKLWLLTPECKEQHHMHTMKWMKHSTFCLQPPGDSPTRKSFYDAVLSGCIPVIFSNKDTVAYPFEYLIDYSKFTVTIDRNFVEKGGDIIDALKILDEDKVSKMRQEIVNVAGRLQYSFPITNRQHSDAVKMILDQVRDVYELNGSQPGV